MTQSSVNTKLLGARTSRASMCTYLEAWLLLVLFLHSACVTSLPGSTIIPIGHPQSHTTAIPFQERLAVTLEPGIAELSVYDLKFMEPNTASSGPVRVPSAEFQRAFLQLSREVRLAQKSPRQAAQELLSLLPESQEVPTVAAQGHWSLEHSHGRVTTFLPERQEGPVVLTPLAEGTLQKQYLQWCAHRGGEDCLGLLDDGVFLRADDRRTLALALSFGSVLDETRAALGHELNARALVSMVVWTVALYCAMWVVPEPTTKAVAATLTVILMGWLGLETMYGLMDGWVQLATVAQEATTFEELRAVGAEFARLMGADAARAMILAVSTLSGRTLGEVAVRMKSLPGYRLAGAQWEAQGGDTVLGQLWATETALAPGESFAMAMVAVEAVATSPQGPLAIVMLKRGSRAGGGQAPGGRSSTAVLRHRGGNQQVKLSDGQRWHLPRGKSLADIPVNDRVGDQLQEAVTRAARQWGSHRLSDPEKEAIQKALTKGKYWLAKLLEREARGRFVHEKVKEQFKRLYRFNHQGADVVDPSPGGYQYEILSGTDSNLARHGRRMAGEFFRMLTF